MNDLSHIGDVASEVRRKGVEVEDPESDRFFFVLRSSSLEGVEQQIRRLREMQGVRDVHVTYYSLEEDRRKVEREGPR